MVIFNKLVIVRIDQKVKLIHWVVFLVSESIELYWFCEALFGHSHDLIEVVT